MALALDEGPRVDGMLAGGHTVAIVAIAVFNSVQRALQALLVRAGKRHLDFHLCGPES